MSIKIKDLQSLLIHEIKDLYSAETQITDALPQMIEAAHDPQLRKAFEHHLDETREHVSRLESICDLLDCKPNGQKCAGMEGLLEEGEDMVDEDAPDEVKDAGLIGAAQRVEHYEMAGYGTARAFAKRLSLNEVAEILGQTLDEEKAADEKLTEIALSHVNTAAVDG